MGAVSDSCGVSAASTHDCGRYGNTLLFAQLDIAASQATRQCKHRHHESPVVAKHVARVQPARELHLVMDDAPALHAPAQEPCRAIRVLAPSGSMFGAAIEAALKTLGWRTPETDENGIQTARVVLVETDEGLPYPPHIADAVPVVTVCLGSVRSLDVLRAMTRQGAIPLDQDQPFRHLVQRVSSVLRQPTKALEAPARLAALNLRRTEVAGLTSLTPSEWHVLSLLVEGQTAGRIAKLLGRSEHTIRSQIRAVLGKLNADSQLVAVAIAQRSSPRPLIPDAVTFTHFGDEMPATRPR